MNQSGIIYSGSRSGYDFFRVPDPDPCYLSIFVNNEKTLWSIKKKNPPTICHFLLQTLFSNKGTGTVPCSIQYCTVPVPKLEINLNLIALSFLRDPVPKQKIREKNSGSDRIRIHKTAQKKEKSLSMAPKRKRNLSGVSRHKVCDILYRRWWGWT